MSDRIVVIGASAAGLRAAARARRLLPGREIVVLDSRQEISVGACGLPYYLSGDIGNVVELRNTPWGALRDAEFFREAKGVEVRTGREVTGLDREGGLVHYRLLDSGAEEQLAFGELVIATGARPRGLPGVPRDHPRVSFFTTVEDARRWRHALQKGEVEALAVVGAGPLGIELAEAFTSMWGAEVQLIESGGHVLPLLLDAEMAAVVGAHLAEQEVQVLCGRRCESLQESEAGLRIVTDAGPLEAEHLICAIGFEPLVALAREAGLELGSTGALAVDEHMRTSDPRVFAAGDCVEVRHRVSERPAHIPLGSLANRQGRVIGDNLAGRDSRFGPVVGSWAVKAFELNVAGTGLSQDACARLGIECAAAWGTFSDRAHYYPGDQPIHLKLVYAPADGRLLGLQAVGRGEGVKRVDVFGNLLARGGSLEDLLELEFCYAPPYAPAVDPLYSLGCAALNQLRDGVASASPASDLAGHPVLDVRTPSESEAAPIPGDVTRIPLRELRGRLDEVPVGEELLVACARGPRSAEAARLLLQHGREGVRYLGGGMSLRGSGAAPSGEGD